MYGHKPAHSTHTDKQNMQEGVHCSECNHSDRSVLRGLPLVFNRFDCQADKMMDPLILPHPAVKFSLLDFFDKSMTTLISRDCRISMNQSMPPSNASEFLDSSTRLYCILLLPGTCGLELREEICEESSNLKPKEGDIMSQSPESIKQHTSRKNKVFHVIYIQFSQSWHKYQVDKLI